MYRENNYCSFKYCFVSVPEQLFPFCSRFVSGVLEGFVDYQLVM